MKRADGLIMFEHLSSPSRSTVGEKENIKANASDFENASPLENASPFVSSNAKGDLRTIERLEDAENLGKSAASRLNSLFA
jgi:hypothetical protein